MPFLVAPLGFFLASASSTRWSRGSLVGLLLALLLAETDISALELLDDLGAARTSDPGAEAGRDKA